MKVAISCDDLLSRDHYTEIVETVAMVYEDAKIYTLAHKEKAMLGTIELRSILSSYLSHNIKDRESLAKNSYLIPKAATNLFIPCTTDVIINISNGMSSGIRKCEETKLITYLYDFFYLNRKKKSLREKIFGGYTKKWSVKALCQSDEIWVPNSAMKEVVQSFFKGEVRIIEPPFRSDDYPVLPIEGKSLDYYAVNTQGLELKIATELCEFLSTYDISYKFFGEDSHLEELKYFADDPRFLGERCSGELAPFLAHSRAIIDLSNDAFPEQGLKGLSCGRPVICKESDNYKSFLGDYGISWISGSSESIIDAVKEMNNKFQTYDRKKLHGITNKFHELKFKSEITRRLSKYNSSDSSPETCC